MTTKINASISAIANLLNLINTDNPNANLSEAKIDFGAPQVVGNPSAGATTIDISPKEGSGIAGGSVTLAYSRLSLTSGVAGGATDLDFTVQGNDAAAAETLLQEVATRLNLVPGEFEISSGTPLSGVAQGGAAVTIGLVPLTTSLLYSVGVEIEVTWPAATLDSLVPNKALQGFEAA